MYKLRFKEDDAVEVGLDEAGRGCLLGRLYVGAVVFSNDIEDFFDNGVALKEIKDSKLLSKRKRDILYDYIQECALDKAVAYAEIDEIDSVNILQADFNCMHRALDSLQLPIDRVLVDGDQWRPYKDIEGHTIVDGDAQYLSIAAAGILAKVSRDRWIEEIVQTHPEWDTHYGLLTNMGYGTAAHMKGISEFGVTPQHRRSYAPVRAALGLPENPKGKGAKKEKEAKGWLGS
jgi:ribonuclease HII